MPYIEDKNGTRFLLGIHRGVVVDRNDDGTVSQTPHRGRIKVRIPFINKDDDHHFWCDYCGPSHQFFSVPDVGTIVYVMFNGGNPEQPIWVGAANSTNASKDPPDRFRRDTPDVSGYESLQGHFLEFDDISGERHIRLEDLNGNYQLYDTELNDWEIFFANDERKEIGRDEHREVGRDVTDDIGRDELRTIGNNLTQDVGNDETETIGNDRTITVENNDDLTVTTGDKSETVETGNKTTDVETGSWINTVEKEYELTGQDRAKFDFQDKIEVVTADNLEFTVTGDWTADVTGNTEWTFTGNWTVDTTGTTEITGSDDITIEATGTKIFTAKNAMFEFEIGAATSTWKLSAGTTSIVLTPASIILTVGATVWTMTSAGVVTTAPAYIISGIDTVTHKHLTSGVPPFTSTWVAGP